MLSCFSRDDISDRDDYVVDSAQEKKQIIPSASSKWNDETLDTATRIAMAIEGGDAEFIDTMLKTHDITTLRSWRSHEGETLLHIACRFGNLPTTAYLLDTITDRTAYINLQSVGLETALHLAMCAKATHLATFLLTCGADPSIPNENKESALYLAAYNGLSDVVDSILLSRDGRALALVVNNDGIPPAAIAAVHGHAEISSKLEKIANESLASA